MSIASQSLRCAGISCDLLPTRYVERVALGHVEFRCRCADGLGYDGRAIGKLYGARGERRAASVAAAGATRPFDLTTLHIPSLAGSHE